MKCIETRKYEMPDWKEKPLERLMLYVKIFDPCIKKGFDIETIADALEQDIEYVEEKIRKKASRLSFRHEVSFHS